VPSLRKHYLLAGACWGFFLAGTGVIPIEGQNNKSQQIYLPDPTPRERDLHDVFSDNPVDRARQQQAVSVQKAKQRDQVVAETDQLVLLAQQLRDSISHSTEGPSVPDVMTAQKIEKLAKSVKEQMKMQ
jgi:hypothetical protein